MCKGFRSTNMQLRSFFLLLLVASAESFVYSCQEVVHRLANSKFEQYAGSASLVTEENFANWEQLQLMYLVSGDYQISLFDLANTWIENTNNMPWRILSYDSTMNCASEFVLILTSDVLTTVQCTFQFEQRSVTGVSSIYVSPQNGMLIYKKAIAGEGNVTVYSGAGIGEEEDRFLLQTWPCESMPNWIISFENVITVEIDEDCSYQFDASSFIEGETTVDRTDRIAILASGRSDNAQNRIGLGQFGARIVTGNDEYSLVTVNMQLHFDPENTGCIGIQKGYSPEVTTYRTDATDQFYASYFEVRWMPQPLEDYEIWKNEDNINIEIQIAHWNDPYDCPEGYSIVYAINENGVEVGFDQEWCYTITWPAPPITGYNYDEAAEFCASTGDTLPILTSKEMNFAVAVFTSNHHEDSRFWIGLTCDTGEIASPDSEKGTWRWEDGQPYEFNAFGKRSDLGSSCDGMANVQSGFNVQSWIEQSPDQECSFVLCGRRIPSPFNPTTSISTSTISHSADSSGLPLWAIIAIVVCVIIFCIGVIIIARRKIFAQRAQFVEESIENKKKLSSHLAWNARERRYIDTPGKINEWEIDRRFVGIEYLQKLGEGAFGSVFLGRVLAKNIPSVEARSIVELSALTNENNAVAVKMLHENADAQREREFRTEIELMQRIGYHERLVNMLACVTLSDPIILVCEYCANGDLLQFMREKRKLMLENPDETDSAKVVTVKKQLMFAIQIAYGMEYLSSRGFIHRDLAARNIMLDHQELCKIGDFGLARSIEGESEHYQAQGGKLPLRWMPPEAIDKFYFSSATDVWSFGVLLFEIITLGGTPYAGWPATEILDRLKRGERMERPDNCSDRLHEVMTACWFEKPSDRPTFNELRKNLGDLLEEVDKDEYYYLTLNAQAIYYVLESNASE